MALIQCTNKLLDYIGTPDKITAGYYEESILGNWHANLLGIDRKKALLFTNDETLYSIFICGFKKTDMRYISEIFMQALRDNLISSGEGEHIDLIISDYRKELNFTKTSSKSVLGSMNDMAKFIDWYIYNHYDSDELKISAINKILNEIPYKAIGFKFAVDLLKQKLKLL